MYSGSDSAESQNVAQWALHPAAYQNMANDQVDWAALAQQWIIMKEAGPPPMPDPKKPRKDKPDGDSGENVYGETDKETKGGITSAAWNSEVTQPQPPGVEAWNWNSQQTWGWNNTWTPPPAGCPPPPSAKAPLLPTPAVNFPYNSSAVAADSASDNATFAGSKNKPPQERYNSTPSNDYQQGYWTSTTTSGGKQVNIKPHNRKYSKVNVPTVQRHLPPAAVPAAVPAPPTVPALDAAKRKALPAWIREGLEKMERDKLKQLEREKMKQNKDDDNEKIKLDERETMEILKNTIQERRKSKFESDGESEDEVPTHKRRTESPEYVPMTHDDLMLKVRKTMTEILLKVTNKEIETICREELQRHLKRSKASDQRVSAPTGANVSARLGLGAYGGDTGSSSDSDEDSQTDRKDSDGDLKESIRRKKADFQRTERDIEGRLAHAERKRADNGSRSSSPDTNDNDSQVDAKYQGRKSCSNSAADGTPQAKSYRDDKHCKRSSSNSENSESDYYGGNSNNRRSSSLDSVDSREHSKHRSETPDRRYKGRADKTLSSTKSNNYSRHSHSKSPVRRHRSRSRSTTRSHRDSGSSKTRYRRSRSSSYSRSRRSRSTSYKHSKTDSRSRIRRTRSRSRDRRSDSRGAHSRSYRSHSSSKRSYKRRSRSSSSGRDKRSRRQ